MKGTGRKAFSLALFLCLLALLVACDTTTPEPTATPTRTPRPTATIRPGWQRHEAPDMEIWLPEEYVAWVFGEVPDVILEAAQAFERNPDAFVFCALGPDVGGSGYVPSVGVARNSLADGVSIDGYLDQVEEQLPDGFSVLQRDSISRRPVESGRMVVEFPAGETSARQLVYTFKEPGGTSLWTVIYSAAAEEFEQLVGDFDYGIYTFSILEW